MLALIPFRFFPRRAMRPSAAAVFTLVALLVGATSAQAKESREVKVGLSQSKAVFESTRLSAPAKDELKLEFDNASHYFNLEHDSEDPGSELEAAIKVELCDLIEWHDANRNGRFDHKGDETVQKIGLGDLVSQSLAHEQVEAGGVKGVKVTGVTSAPDKYPGFTTTLTLQMFGQFLDTEGISLEPTAMKFDIAIQGFPYMATGSSLALLGEVSIEAEERAGPGDAETGVAGRSGKFISFFDWGGLLIVDGHAATIGQIIVKEESKVTGTDSERSTELYMLYPRGRLIVHDPIMGVRIVQVGGGCDPF